MHNTSHPDAGLFQNCNFEKSLPSKVNLIEGFCAWSSSAIICIILLGVHAMDNMSYPHAGYSQNRNFEEMPALKSVFD